MRKVYENTTFIIMKEKQQCILINKKKMRKFGFENSHTHLNNYGTCRYLMRISERKEVPERISPYLLQSLIRVNSNKEYLEELYKLQELQGK